MKKALAFTLTFVMVMGLLSGCGGGSTDETTTSEVDLLTETTGSSNIEPAEITVVTSYGGDDGNRPNYENAIRGYEEATGNKVKDASAISNEEWKARIMSDFETGAEPDVLFYFNGVDSNKLIESGKVVSIDEIRAVYPDYVANMKDEMLVESSVDGKKYSVPINGYWEGLYVNLNVLEDCGVSVPDANYTWEQFLADCETIKSKGYTPIACSLQEVPHYWFEFTILNNSSVEGFSVLPTTSSDEAGKAWVDGLNDIKELYEKGYFPKNTTTSTDPETFQLMADNEAAFAIDGSWKLGWFAEYANEDDYIVTYVPAKGERVATDVIGGLSMGYYITKKAWDNPEKRDAAVKFVMYMSQDNVVSTFGVTAITALKNGTTTPEDVTPLVQSALDMTKGATSVIPAVQDKLSQSARVSLFADLKNVATGKVSPADSVNAALAIKE